MTRFIDQEPNVGKMCVVLDGRVPDAKTRNNFLRLALGRVHILPGVSLPDELVQWLRQVETIGWDIYAERAHFRVIDLAAEGTRSIAVSGA